MRKERLEEKLRYLLICSALALGACSNSTPPLPSVPVATGLTGCVTSSVSIHFDFDGAAPSRCVIEGDRQFSIIVSPEHASPINPSPWYAFRYTAKDGPNVSVTLRYLLSKHRYLPKLEADGQWLPLDVVVSDDGAEARFLLPPGEGLVAGQEVFDAARHHALIERLARYPSAQQLVLGYSHDGRPIDALQLGDPQAEKIIVLLGRAHPPEVTGALAMETFLEEIAQAVDGGALAGVQILAVPQLNPDGVARGHWRANLGGQDLNRDWGEFTQPETRAVATWLNALPPKTRPIAMVDFHSTQRNLFYVQGEEETNAVQERFLVSWLGGQEHAITEYPFTIERRNANPGSGTSKNWFHGKYGIPAYTYEVGDETDRQAIKQAARVLAQRFVEAASEL